MKMIALISYILLSYGLSNLIVYSNGPFHIFLKWREISHKIGEKFGELFTCMLCISTWIGLLLSIIDIYVIKNYSYTPYNILMPECEYKILVMVFDMGFTSASVWLLHQLEEMFERIGNNEEYEEL